MGDAVNLVRRLLLLVLPLVLALGPMPVAAAPDAMVMDHHAMHDMTMDMGDHAPAPRPDHHATAHCLGCVAPVTLGTPQLVSPVPLSPTLAALPLPTLASPAAAPPATPPPRID